MLKRIALYLNLSGLNVLNPAERKLNNACKRAKNGLDKSTSTARQRPRITDHSRPTHRQCFGEMPHNLRRSCKQQQSHPQQQHGREDETKASTAAAGQK